MNSTCGREELVSPGHVFPLAARDGGVLVRAGHTEAAVDIARIAGLNPSGVICEVMNDDGTMARLPELIAFAERHGLKVGTIRDLIVYRLRNDHLVESVDNVPFISDYGGAWTFLSYRNKVTGEFSYVLKKGKIVPGQPTLVRVHAASLLSDMLGQAGPRKRILQRAMAQIGAAGSGVILIIAPQLDGNVHQMLEGVFEGMDERSYGIGAQILADLNIHDMILLTNTPGKSLVGLEAFGLSIVEERAIENSAPLG